MGSGTIHISTDKSEVGPTLEAQTAKGFGRLAMSIQVCRRGTNLEPYYHVMADGAQQPCDCFGTIFNPESLGSPRPK